MYKIVDTFNGFEGQATSLECCVDELIEARGKFHDYHANARCCLTLAPVDSVWRWDYERNQWQWTELVSSDHVYELIWERGYAEEFSDL